jgi:hypothetical protein
MDLLERIHSELRAKRRKRRRPASWEGVSTLLPKHEIKKKLVLSFEAKRTSTDLFSSLGCDLLALVSEFLDYADLMRGFGSVCTALNQVVSCDKFVKRVKFLSISSLYFAEQRVIRIIDLAARSLQILYIRGSMFFDDHVLLSVFGNRNFVRLEELHLLHCSQLSDVGIIQLSKSVPKLKKMRIIKGKAWVRSIDSYPKRITNKTLKALVHNCHHIQDISVSLTQVNLDGALWIVKHAGMFVQEIICSSSDDTRVLGIPHTIRFIRKHKHLSTTRPKGKHQGNLG